MKVVGSIEWRAFSSGCREVVRLQVHTGWRMERFDRPKHQDTNEVRDSVQGPTSVSKNHEQSHIQLSRNLVYVFWELVRLLETT